jgi:hypothetical protein
MLLKRPAEAENTLEQCLNACKRDFVTEDALQKRQAQFDEYLSKFQPTAEQILKNAKRKPTNKTLEERPALDKEYQKYAKENRDHFNYTVLAKSHTRFFKRKDEIISDAEYALAKATAQVKARGAIEQMQEQKAKELEIEEQKKKLEQQMKELQDNQGK